MPHAKHEINTVAALMTCASIKVYIRTHRCQETEYLVPDIFMNSLFHSESQNDLAIFAALVYRIKTAKMLDTRYKYISPKCMIF